MSTLSPGYSAVPAGHLAAIVTTLEMRVAPDDLASPARGALGVRRVAGPDNAWYLGLYRAIGEDWLWTSRLRKSAEELSAILGDPGVEVYALTHDGRDGGLLELDFRVAGDCEIAFFGVTPGMVGTGAAHHLMRHAIATAWPRGISRLWLHTCTLDHPRALAFYMRAGFTPIKREVEIFADPRLSGLAPRGSSPAVPIL